MIERLILRSAESTDQQEKQLRENFTPPDYRLIESNLWPSIWNTVQILCIYFTIKILRISLCLLFDTCKHAKSKSEPLFGFIFVKKRWKIVSIDGNIKIEQNGCLIQIDYYLK